MKKLKFFCPRAEFSQNLKILGKFLGRAPIFSQKLRFFGVREIPYRQKSSKKRKIGDRLPKFRLGGQ